MEQKRLLGRFRRRLFGQALIRSLLWGMTAGAAALFVCSVIWHLLIKTPSVIWLAGSFAAGFIVGFAPCMVLNFPTYRRVAARLDQTGLQERVGTMLQFGKNQGLMVELQRKDAAQHIRETASNKLKPRISLKELLALGIAAALCVTMLLIPYDLLAPPPEKPDEVTQWESEVHTMIDGLRQQLRDSYLTAEAQAEIDAILAQLEQDLLNTDSELEQAALIQQAQDDIQDVLYNTISRRVIGRAMQQYDLTTGLGAQISKDDHFWEISDQMAQMKRDITGPNKQLTKLGNNLHNALEISGADPADGLYMALDEFGTALIDMANYTIGPDAEQGWTMSDLDFLFEVSEERIFAALEQQSHDEAEVANMDGMISQSLQSLMDQAGENTPQQGGKPQSMGQSGKQPQGSGEGNSDGTPIGGMFDDGGLDPERTTMLEGIYDPMSGDVTYGEVFAAYYAQYLQMLDAGEIPEELRSYFERYFSSLS